MVYDITDKLIPQIQDWQQRPLSEVYPIVFIDAIHFSVLDNHIIKKLAAYIILGINEEGKKEFAKDLKTIYHAASEEQGYSIMLEITEKWQSYYPNAIESLNSSYRRLNRQRSVFPSELNTIINKLRYRQ